MVLEKWVADVQAACTQPSPDWKDIIQKLSHSSTDSQLDGNAKELDAAIQVCWVL